MKVSVKYDSLSDEARVALSQQVWLLNAVKRTLRAVSLGVERRIKAGPPMGMPKDTGRAAASWGHWTPGDITNNPDANPLDAEWKESPDGLTITQGSNVEYVGALNDGHSKQSPAGFLDAAEEAGVRELDNELSALADAL